MVERQSYAVLVTGIVLLILGLFLRRVVEWYAETHLPNVPPGPWDQLRLGGSHCLRRLRRNAQSKSPDEPKCRGNRGSMEMHIRIDRMRIAAKVEPSGSFYGKLCYRVGHRLFVGVGGTLRCFSGIATAL